MKAKSVYARTTKLVVWVFFISSAVILRDSVHFAALAAIVLVGGFFVAPEVAKWVIAAPDKPRKFGQ